MPEVTLTDMRQRERDLAARDPVMARLIAAAGPCTWEPQLEILPFETLARAIAHQQLNGIAAESIFSRFKALYAPARFPEPAAVLATPEAALRAAGFPLPRSARFSDLAEKVAAGVVPTTEQLHALDSDAIIERITQVRGIGRWTVEMLLMFQLGRPDVLPVDDFGVCNGFRLLYGLKGMPRPRALAEFGERWAPHRSLPPGTCGARWTWHARRNCRAAVARHESRYGRSGPSPQPKNRPSVR